MSTHVRLTTLFAAAFLLPAASTHVVSAQEPTGASGTSSPQSAGPAVRPIQVTEPAALHWQHDAEFPDLDRALLYGTQTSAEPYVYRLRAYAPARLPLHAHARTEYITVLQGTLHHAPEGETRASARACAAGCFVVVPPGQAHQGWLEAGTVLQVHGVGPTEAHPPGG